MPIICPTVLAADQTEYETQINKIGRLGKRLQIDLSDGQFAPTPTVGPAEAWWPIGFQADIHLMYKDPRQAIRKLSEHKPNLVIVHAEAEVDFDDVYKLCQSLDLRLGLALLPATPASAIDEALNKLEHVLIFSGELGHFGGHADLSLLEKADYLKRKQPDLEIGWDGGINERNVSELVFGGIDVLNVGGYLQKADDPQKAYSRLFRIAEETGTT